MNGKMITKPKEILQHFRSYFEDLSSSKQPLPDTLANLSSIECASFLNEEKILDVEVCVEEIEVALNAMQLRKSGGGDGLDPEHSYYGGEILSLAKESFQLNHCTRRSPTSPKGRCHTPCVQRKG